MTALRLINNPSLEEEKNLCFVNSSLQLLYCIPEARKFFINQEYKINQDESADLIYVMRCLGSSNLMDIMLNLLPISDFWLVINLETWKCVVVGNRTLLIFLDFYYNK